MSFEFDYGSSGEGSAGGRRPGSRGRRARPPRRRGGMIWVLWFCAALLGAGASVSLAVVAGEVRAIGDAAFWRAAIGIAAALLLSLPGFSFYWLARSSAYPNWHERVWRPTALVRISLLSSVGAALWCGYLIAVRVAREWPT